ncbi:hypothetical protein QYF61_009633 [Mycteria americana]|uniref:Uncharacterized protein n=1 Tax=Mycteria americana TaxID=33587 RepID=A0AAN7S0N0_MYCAM|nr:hypothetical protein QYF61_009633 [Mycteria americana]
MLDNPFSEVKFPNIHSKPPLAQLEAISSRPITCYLGEETDPHLSTTSFQAKQPQFPQPLLIRLLLQTLHQLHCPSLDTLQHLNVSLVVRGPKLNTVFEVQPHQCRVQRHDHFPSPAGHTITDTSQDAIGFLGHLGTLLAHIQTAVNQHPQVLFCLAAFQPLFPKPVALHGVAVTQVQDLALGLVKPHTIDLVPWIQPVQVPLQSLPTLKQINTPTQLGIICKLTEGAPHPFIQIIDKDIKQNWPQHRALGNTTGDRPPTGVKSIHHHSLGPAIQPVFYPAKSPPVQAMSSQFLQENVIYHSKTRCLFHKMHSYKHLRGNSKILANSVCMCACAYFATQDEIQLGINDQEALDSDMFRNRGKVVSSIKRSLLPPLRDQVKVDTITRRPGLSLIHFIPGSPLPRQHLYKSGEHLRPGREMATTRCGLSQLHNLTPFNSRCYLELTLTGTLEYHCLQTGASQKDGLANILHSQPDGNGATAPSSRQKHRISEFEHAQRHIHIATGTHHTPTISHRSLQSHSPQPEALL